MAQLVSEFIRQRPSMGGAYRVGALIRRLGLLAALFAICAIPLGAMGQSTSTLVEFDFGTLGKVDVDLYNQLAPLSTANFLQNYVNTGLYNGTIIHRLTHSNPDGIGVVQGGGFNTLGVGISTASPVNLEYSAPNARGTLAMARAIPPNSGTSQWFFNDIDDSTALAPNATGAGYAVFGHVVGPGMSVIDAIANLQYGDFSSPTFFNNGALTATPVKSNYTQADYTNGVTPSAQQLVVLNSVTVLKTHAAYENPILATDVNNDGILSPSDLATVLGDVASNGIHQLNGAYAGLNYLDVSGDGKVSPLDIATLVEAFSTASSHATVAGPHSLVAPMVVPAAVTPEPSSLILAAISVLALGGCAVGRRRRRAGRC